MALPPCHVMSQFIVKNNDLTCILYQRSGDIGLGIPFNIASYSFLTHILAKHCGLNAKEFIHIIGDAHIYEEHTEALEEQIKKKPKEFPTLEILNNYENIDDYNLKDIKINNYKYHKKVYMEMKE
jgi:thymidylate synthase